MGKKKLCAFVLTLLLGLSGLFAADTAVFVDLGFSQDGRTFMFAQYGVNSGTLRPWADLFVVDVARNSFVEGGRVSYVHSHAIIPGRDGSGAFHHALSSNSALAQRYRINHNTQGRPLFVAVDGAVNPSGFRDFETGASFRAELVQNRNNSGAAVSASFHINLEHIDRNGLRKTYVVGNPNFSRPNIAGYRIRQVMIYGDAMVFVMEMQRQDGADFSIRYMVETLRL
jgi:predicted secreted protein